MADKWEIEVKPGKPAVHLIPDKGKGTVLGRGKEKTVLFYSTVPGVDPDKFYEWRAEWEDVSLPLKLEIEIDDTVSFRVTGDRTIRLSGRIEFRNPEKKQNTSGVPKSLLKSPSIPSNSMFISGNITNRVFERRMRNPPPGASVNRRFYENILPSSTLSSVKDTPAEKQNYLKLTDDGQYLISLRYVEYGRIVIIYQVSLCSYASSASGYSHASKFSSYATRLCSTIITENLSESVVDFFLHVPAHGLGIFASLGADLSDGPGPDRWYKLSDKLRSKYSTRIMGNKSISFHLIRLSDGEVVHSFGLNNDYIDLLSNTGATLWDNSLVLTLSRSQSVRIYEIAPSGFIHKRTILFTCIDENKLFANDHDGFRSRRHPQAQLLDVDHLFIKFGCDTSGVAEELHAIFKMSTRQVVPFCKHEGSYQVFDSFGEYFNIQVTTSNDIFSSYLTGHIDFARLWSIRKDTKLLSRAVGHLQRYFPFEVRSSSPYLEPSLFSIDNKGLSVDKYDSYKGGEAVFVSRRYPKQKFNIKAGGANSRMAFTNACVLVHPYLPLMISIMEGINDSISIHRP